MSASTIPLASSTEYEQAYMALGTGLAVRYRLWLSDRVALHAQLVGRTRQERFEMAGVTTIPIRSLWEVGYGLGVTVEPWRHNQWSQIVDASIGRSHLFATYLDCGACKSSFAVGTTISLGTSVGFKLAKRLELFAGIDLNLVNINGDAFERRLRDRREPPLAGLLQFGAALQFGARIDL